MKLQKINAPLEKTNLGKFLYIKLIEDEIFYFVKNEIIFSHQISDINVFKQFICQIYLVGLVKQTDLSKLFEIKSITVKRWIRKYKETSTKIFLNNKRHGHSYKLTQKVLARIQNSIHQGLSLYKIAKNENISVSSIKKAIKSGKLYKRKIENVNTEKKQKINLFDTDDTFERPVLQKDCKQKISL